MAYTKVDSVIQDITDTSINSWRTTHEIVTTVTDKAHVEVTTPISAKYPLDYSIIAKGSSEEIRKLAKEYETKEFRALMLETTCRGNNPLHLAAHFNTPKSIATILTLIGEEGSALAVQSNADGLPPFQLLNQNKKLAKTGELSEAKSIMGPITKSAPTSDFSELIDINKLLSERYPHLISSPQKDYLELAVQAVNETRKLIKHSSTHLAVNLDGSEEQREQFINVNNKIISNRKIASAVPLNSFKETAELYSKYAIESKVGNCSELACMMFANLKNKGFTSSSEVLSLNHGDHIFNVIGRIPGSNLNDPTTWGDNAIVADAWSGDVYLASELSSRLKGYRSIQYQGVYQCYLEPFNPRFHKLAVRSDSYPTEEKPVLPSSALKAPPSAPNKLVTLKTLQKTFAADQKEFIDAESASQRKLAELTSTRERGIKANKNAIANAERRMHEIKNENKDANGESYGFNPFGKALAIITIGAVPQRWMRDYRAAHTQKHDTQVKGIEDAKAFVASYEEEMNKLEAARADWKTKLEMHHAEAVKLMLDLNSSAFHSGYNGILSALGKEEKLSARASKLAEQTHSAYKLLHGEAEAANRTAQLTDLHQNKRGEYLAALTGTPGRMIEDTINVGGFFAHVAREGAKRGVLAVNGVTEHFVTESDPFSDSVPVDPIRVTEAHAEVARFLESISVASKTVASESRKTLSSTADLVARTFPSAPRGGDDMDIGYASDSDSTSSGNDTSPTPEGTATPKAEPTTYELAAAATPAPTSTPDSTPTSTPTSTIEDDEIGYSASWSPN